ncbi:MAG: ATP-binding protein [Clostridiales bacterium]|nr:ATP-binding protein [Clostridiales bacterium]
MIFEVKNYASLQEAVDLLCSFLLKEGVPSDSIFDSKLVAYELLGNVLKHADGKAKLHGSIVDGFVELKIYTETAFILPKEKLCPDTMAEHGRGLFLVNEVCEERFYSDEDGIRVQIRIKKA